MGRWVLRASVKTEGQKALGLACGRNSQGLYGQEPRVPREDVRRQV